MAMTKKAGRTFFVKIVRNSDTQDLRLLDDAMMVASVFDLRATGNP